MPMLNEETIIDLIKENKINELVSNLKEEDYTYDDLEDYMGLLFMHTGNNSFKYSHLQPIFECIYDKYVTKIMSTYCNYYETSFVNTYISNVIKLQNGYKLLYKFKKKKLAKIVNYMYGVSILFYNSVKYGSLLTIKLLEEVLKDKLKNFCMKTVTRHSLYNSDDRVFKYILEKEEYKNTLNKIINKSFSYSRQSAIDFSKVFFYSHIPEKYILRKIKYVTELIDIKDNLFFIGLLTHAKTIKCINNIIKHNMGNQIFFDSTIKIEIIYNMFKNIIKVINETHNNYFEAKAAIYKLYSMITKPLDKDYFVITLVTQYNTFFDLTLNNDSDPLYIRYITLIHDEYDINKNFFKLFDRSIHDLYIKEKFQHIKTTSYNFNMTLLTTYKYTDTRMFNNYNQRVEICKINKIYFYLKLFVRMVGNKLRVRRDFKKAEKLWNNVNTKIIHVKHKYIPPYHVFPSQFNTLNTCLIKEKSDGVLVHTLPDNIEPSLGSTNYTAEYVEDLDLYLVFDYNDDKSYRKKYEYLRSLHPHTRHAPNHTITDFDMLVLLINDERTRLKHFLDQPYTSYRWYPKAAWEVNFSDVDEMFIPKLNDIINGTNKHLINWLCYSGPVPNDGFIISPIGRKREIKIKPRELMTIDIIYKAGSWEDRDGYKYDDIIESKDKYDDNTIYRCYPNGNKYIPKEPREDKKKPNPREVVNNIIHLNKIDFSQNFPQLYFDSSRINSDIFNQYVLENTDIIYNTVSSDNIKNTRVLDLGCGKGKIIKYLPKCQYYGIDYDMNNIVKSISKHNGPKRIFNYMDLSKTWNNTENKLYMFDFEKYDTIYCINSIMHFWNDLFWEQVNKCAEPGTMMVFNVVNDTLDIFTFEKSYIKRENEHIKYLFESVHDKEHCEMFISKDMINMILEKYKWVIKKEFNGTGNLTQFYTWYIIEKIV